LSVFHIAADGKLEYVRSYDTGNGGQPMFWMGMVPLC